MNDYLPLLTALVSGVLVGGVSLLGIWIQASSAARVERLRQVALLSLEDYKLRLPLMIELGAERPPVVAFLDYYDGLMRLMEKDEVSPETLRTLSEKHEKILTTLREMARERTQAAANTTQA